jgi:hypothetical protein
VPGFDVSNLGRVWNVSRGRLLEGSIRDGLRVVCLFLGGRRSEVVAVRALVAEAFIGPRPEGLEIGHLNHDRLDCRAENLAYLPRSETRYRSGPVATPRHRSREISDEEIVQLVTFRSYGTPIGALARSFGISKGYASKICLGISDRARRLSALRLQETGAPLPFTGPSGRCQAQEHPAEPALSTPAPYQVAPGASRRTR